MFGLTTKVTEIIGGVMAVAIIGLALALTITRGTLEKRTLKLEKTEALLKAESNAHDTTIASLSGCRVKMNETNAAADARAKADAERLVRYQQRVEALQADARASDERIERLKGIAQHAAGNPSCAAPTALLKELEGL